MTFLNPTLALIGALSVMIPIIIHILMRRKRRPVAWGAMRFLVEAYKRQRRRMNLEQILLLAARCLLVLLIGMALGKPILGAAAALNDKAPRTVYLLIDNSLTASTPVGARGDDRALDRFKSAALSMIDSLDQNRGDKVAVISLGSPAEGAVAPASSELNAARQVVKDLPQTHARADWPGAVRLVREDIIRKDAKGGDDVWMVLLSEWRAGSIDLESTLGQFASLGAVGGGGASNITVLANAPTSDPADNISIVAVEPARSILMPGGAGGGANAGESGGTPVRVVLRRSGPSVATSGVSKVRVVAAIAAGEVADTTPDKPNAPQPSTVQQIVNWSAGMETTEVFVTIDAPSLAKTKTSLDRPPVLITATIDEDAISGDNTFRRPVELRERLEVGLISPGSVGIRGGIGDYTAADWFALALSPRGDLTLRQRQTGEIRVQIIDPQLGIAPSVSGGGGGRNAGVLTGLDAILIPRPELLDAQGWSAVKEVYQNGALVMVCPSSGREAQLWTDDFKTAMGLDWEIGRESKEVVPAASIIIGNAAKSMGGGGEGVASADSGRAGGLLSIVAAELPELVRPVTVSRVLPLRATSTGAFDVLLALSDGTPLIVVGSGWGDGEVEAENQRTAESDGAGKPADPGIRKSAGTQPSRGTIVFFTSALDVKWTDLPARPLVVPLMQELVRQGVGRSVASRSQITGTPGGAGSFPIGGVDLSRIGAAGGEDASLASVIGINAMGAAQSSIRNSSAWVVRSAAGATMGVVAFNADPAAGATTPQQKDEVARYLSPVSNKVRWIDGPDGNLPGGVEGAGAGEPGNRDAMDVLGPRSNPPPISVPLLLAAVAVAALELLMARWFSHAKRDAFITQSSGLSGVAGGGGRASQAATVSKQESKVA